MGYKQLKRIQRRIEAPLAFLFILLIWQYGAAAIQLPDYILPVPTVILARFWETFLIQVHHLAYTGLTTLIGLFIALFAGVPLALSVLYIRPIKAIVLPSLAAFNSIPKIAIAPLFVIWFGLGIEPKILLAFLLSLFPIFVGSITGLGEIEPDILDLAKLAGGTETRIFFKVRLMNATPYIIDAVKVAFPLALVGSIVGEFIGGNRGVGYLILSGQFNLDTALVFATLLTITLFTTVIIKMVDVLERLLLHWRPSQRKR